LFFPLSPICGRELERRGDCIQVYSCILSPSPLSLSHQRERGKNFFKFPPFLRACAKNRGKYKKQKTDV